MFTCWSNTHQLCKPSKLVNNPKAVTVGGYGMNFWICGRRTISLFSGHVLLCWLMWRSTAGSRKALHSAPARLNVPLTLSRQFKFPSPPATVGVPFETKDGRGDPWSPLTSFSVLKTLYSGCVYTMTKWRLTSGHGFALKCGANHDSDVNAAKNIKAVGLITLAHGATVKPQSRLMWFR